MQKKTYWWLLIGRDRSWAIGRSGDGGISSNRGWGIGSGGEAKRDGALGRGGSDEEEDCENLQKKRNYRFWATCCSILAQSWALFDVSVGRL